MDSTIIRIRSTQAQANPLGIAKIFNKPKINTYKPVTGAYTIDP